MSDELGAYRNDGPDTMFEGAAAVGPKIKSMHRRVLELFKQAQMQGMPGLTDPQLVYAYGKIWGHCIYRSVSTRRRELVDKGLLVDTGLKHKNPTTHVNNIVWGLSG